MSEMWNYTRTTGRGPIETDMFYARIYFAYNIKAR